MGFQVQSVTDNNWMDQAYCSDPDNYYRAFNADIFTSASIVDQKMALKMCDLCDVKEICLQYAIDNDETYGIWGGTTAEERKILYRQKKRRSAQRRAAYE